MVAVIIPIGIGGLVFFALWFWAILDVIAMDSILVRSLPKQTWIFIVIFLPTAGALAWLLLGRPEGAGLSVGGNYRPPDYRTQRRRRGIEDSPEWKATTRRSTPDAPASAQPTDADVGESAAVKERRLLEWEAELKKREAALGEDSTSSDEPPADS